MGSLLRNVMKKLLIVIFCAIFTTILYSQEDPYKPVVDEMPEPVGGYDAIYKKIEYPPLAQKSGVQGKVYLLVYISEKGSVDDVKVVRSLGAGCDEAAMDVIKKTRFTPGKLQGQTVKVKLTVPIIFKMR